MEYSSIPETNGVPLIADMSSNFCSRPFDITKFAMVFAGAQKNVGPAGITLCIIKSDFLGQARAMCPTMLDYAVGSGGNCVTEKEYFDRGGFFCGAGHCKGVVSLQHPSLFHVRKKKNFLVFFCCSFVCVCPVLICLNRIYITGLVFQWIKEEGGVEGRALVYWSPFCF